MPEPQTTTAPTATTTVPAPVAANPDIGAGGGDSLFSDANLGTEPKAVATETKATETSSISETKPVESLTTRLYADRFKTPEDLEIAYRESSSEGLRLYRESREHQQAVTEAKSRIADLEAQLAVKMASPFKELSKEDLAKMEPDERADYLVEKKFHDREMKEAQAKMKAENESRERHRIETEKYILDRGNILSSNPKQYPNYNELIPDMEYLGNRLGSDVVGKGWAPDFLYLAALGRTYLQKLKAGDKATSEADAKAKAAAKAAAAAGGPGPTSPTQIETKDSDSDEEFVSRILKADPNAAFRVAA